MDRKLGQMRFRWAERKIILKSRALIFSPFQFQIELPFSTFIIKADTWHKMSVKLWRIFSSSFIHIQFYQEKFWQFSPPGLALAVAAYYDFGILSLTPKPSLMKNAHVIKPLEIILNN